MSRMKSTAVALSVAAVFVIAAACSGGGGGAKGTSNDAAGLKSATKDFSERILSDDAGGAYDYLTADCKKKISKDKFSSVVKTGLNLIKAFAGKNASNLKVGDVQTRNVKNGEGESRAQLLGSDGKPIGGTSGSYDAWVYQDGSWHPKSCDLSSSGTSGSSGSSGSSDSGSFSDFSANFSDFSGFSDYSGFSDLDSALSQLSDIGNSFSDLFSS